MKWIKVKSDKEMALDGVTIETDWTNGQLTMLILKVGDKQVKVQYHDYGIGYFVPEPPKTVTAYELTATLPIIGAVTKTYKDQYEANDAKHELSLRMLPDGEGNTPVKVERVEVSEEEMPF